MILSAVKIMILGMILIFLFLAVIVLSLQIIRKIAQPNENRKKEKESPGHSKKPE